MLQGQALFLPGEQRNTQTPSEKTGMKHVAARHGAHGPTWGRTAVGLRLRSGQVKLAEEQQEGGTWNTITQLKYYFSQWLNNAGG